MTRRSSARSVARSRRRSVRTPPRRYVTRTAAGAADCRTCSAEAWAEARQGPPLSSAISTESRWPRPSSSASRPTSFRSGSHSSGVTELGALGSLTGHGGSDKVRHVRHGSPFFVLLLALTLVAAACGGGGGNKTSNVGSNANVPKGGTLVVGAEQEPDCMDWIGSCSGSSWGYWIANVETTPHAYNVVKKGSSWGYEVSNLLTGEADLKTSPQQVVTYHINPAAKWSDGQPITAHDFKYIWDQIANGSDIYDTTGYVDIQGVDDSNPSTPVVTFKTPFADWKSLFGGQYGLMPSHLLEGKDRDKETTDGYTWSGGPWMMPPGGWQKGTQITLVPNPNYWGTKPKLDKIVYKIIKDTSAEFQAFKAGETMLIYPQPQPDAVDQIQAGLT